jgi:hypothetical protein
MRRKKTGRKEKKVNRKGKKKERKEAKWGKKMEIKWRGVPREPQTRERKKTHARACPQTGERKKKPDVTRECDGAASVTVGEIVA